ncbi:MAG: sulfotransferase [Chloroflexota bacterium]|nr:sulfotransferase [Chloroflexota bacterium]
MTQHGYIFIVGSSRTGTSLLRNILNSSEDVAICDETHFFGDPKTIASLLRNVWHGSKKIARWGESHFLERLTNQGIRQELTMLGDISTDAGAEKIVDYLYHTCWHWAPHNFERKEFLHQVLVSDRTDRSLFDLVMACYANGKPIRGEKTPAHIHYVPTLLEWFPNAKIIHTFRDPRAIFTLQREKPFTRKGLNRRQRIFRRSALPLEIYASLDIAITWLRTVQLHHQYQERYPNNYYLFKYEDLLDAPQIHLKKLCDFLEIRLTEEMLQRTFQDSAFGPCSQTRESDTWAANCRREHLHPATNKLFVRLCKKHLLEFGYPL